MGPEQSEAVVGVFRSVESQINSISTGLRVAFQPRNRARDHVLSGPRHRECRDVASCGNCEVLVTPAASFLFNPHCFELEALRHVNGQISATASYLAGLRSVPCPCLGNPGYMLPSRAQAQPTPHVPFVLPTASAPRNKLHESQKNIHRDLHNLSRSPLHNFRKPPQKPPGNRPVPHLHETAPPPEACTQITFQGQPNSGD